MRYELSDYEWTAIKPMLPNKPRGVRRVNDRRVLNGIFWVLRSGAPWRDLPEAYGPRTTCYNLVAFDYAEPFQNYLAERRASIIAAAESAAARGEPWLSLFDPADLHELLRSNGFKTIAPKRVAKRSGTFHGPWLSER